MWREDGRHCAGAQLRVSVRPQGRPPVGSSGGSGAVSPKRSTRGNQPGLRRNDRWARQCLGSAGHASSASSKSASSISWQPHDSACPMQLGHCSISQPWWWMPPMGEPQSGQGPSAFQRGLVRSLPQRIASKFHAPDDERSGAAHVLGHLQTAQRAYSHAATSLAGTIARPPPHGCR